MKEYGGYFSIELGEVQKEYYVNPKYEVRHYNSGRAAIYMAIKNLNAKRVWLPWYLCTSVSEFLKKKSIQFVYYNIDEDFLPENIEEQEGDVVIWPHYFGTMRKEIIEKVFNSYGHVVFDNTQAFYSEPMREAYNIYSPRKFFGVSDGAYLIADKFTLSEENLLYSNTLSTINYMLKAADTSTNEAYLDSLENEKRIESEDVMHMSIITNKILKTINYERIKESRNQNFHILDEILGTNNILCFEKKVNAPMVYPFLCRSENLRQKLISSHIYVAQWWKSSISNRANNWEKELSKYLIPLPIDQRYCISDMEKIAEIVKKEIG